MADGIRLIADKGIEVPVMCPHTPRCPASDAWDHAAARTVAAHPEQGWSLLCNGVIVFDDTGELLPGGRIVLPRPAVLPGLNLPHPRMAAA